MKKSHKLPIREEKVVIGQGYDSRFSHRDFPELGVDDTYSLDFRVDNVNVYPTRNGIVHLADDSFDFNYSGTDWEESVKAAEKANYFIIDHEDGTYSVYLHLAKDSISKIIDEESGLERKLQLGDKVNTDQVIAVSGNTGWSTQPHLHFAVYREDRENGYGRRTMRISFEDFDGPLDDRILHPERYEAA